MNKDWKEATRQNDLETARLLLENGADVNARDEHGQTALMNAAHAGHFDLVRLLVERGADLDITAKYNLSALMLSLVARHTEIAKFLIEAGADISIRSTRDFGAQTALSLAVHNGNLEIVSLLKSRGAIS